MHISNSLENPAVRVTSGCKTYGKNVVLHDLDMTVPVGNTYALLGSSGCGKTTLLSSLVGLRKLSSGSIQIFGQDASQTDRTSVGYMPQESGLHPELTISEELHYFGRLYGLEWTVVEERINFFVNLLQLPRKDPFIRNLSGGETRRVSLAVALLHKPNLLIMDEPTVGVDPLLRQSIWDYLHKIVKEDGTTIILSTHYTEEARHVDVVSVMRNGRLLVEQNPQSLMKQYDSEVLEHVVVKLCRSQDMENSNDANQYQNGIPIMWRPRRLDIAFKNDVENIVNVSYKRRNSVGEILEQETTQSRPRKKFKRNSAIRHLQIIYAILVLNMIVYIRHPAILVFKIFLPITDMTMVWATYKQIPNTDIGVVNLEQPNCFQLPVNQHKLGCDLSTYLHASNTLKLEEFPSEESALAAVQLGRNYGYIVLPSNFSRNMQNRVAFGRFADRRMLDGSSIVAHLDYSNYVRNFFLLDGILSGLEGFVDEQLNETAITSEQTGFVNFGPTFVKPFKINKKMEELGAVETTWHDIGAVARMAWYTVILPSCISVLIIWDKKQGSFNRTIVGGGHLPHIFLGNVASYFFLFLGQVGFARLALVILNIPFKGSMLDLGIVNYGQSLVGLSYGFLLGIVLNQENETIFFIIALAMFSLTAQGEVSSLYGVDYWVRWFVLSLPTKLASISVENIVFRGWTVFHSGVWSCFIVQAGWIFSCLGLTGLIVHKGQS